MSPRESELDALTLREWSILALVGAQYSGGDTTFLPSWLGRDGAEQRRPVWLDLGAVAASLATVAYLAVAGG